MKKTATKGVLPGPEEAARGVAPEDFAGVDRGRRFLGERNLSSLWLSGPIGNGRNGGCISQLGSRPLPGKPHGRRTHRCSTATFRSTKAPRSCYYEQKSLASTTGFHQWVCQMFYRAATVAGPGKLLAMW